jgi:hypothetical protein
MYLVLGIFLFIARKELQGMASETDCGGISQKFALLGAGRRNE